jgi:leucyl aminopeptidase
MPYQVNTPKISLATSPLSAIDADLIVVSGLQDAPLAGAALDLDREIGGLLQRLVESGSFKGRAFETEWVYPAPLAAGRVLLIGAGKQDEYGVRVLRRVAAAAVRQARTKKATRVCLALQPPDGVSPEWFVQEVADGVVTGLSDSDLYKDRSKKGSIEHVVIWEPSGNHEQAALDRGRQIGEAVNFARWLGDEPANVMTPERVAEEVLLRANELGVECEVLDEQAIRALEMNSLLSVAQGSKQPPRVVVLRYKGGDGPLLGIVGKGVTFDTGGISIKPAADMHYMKYDMCGAAATVSAVLGLAALKAKCNVIGVVGLVENMPSDRATRPGDVVRAANGKSIEIINTDAEGRLVLADALDLARKRGAERLVDLATLTGAIKIALGTAATGAMGKPQSWVESVLRAAETVVERAWQMPLYPEYLEQLKSNIADLMNTGGRNGGALTAGTFLQQFVADTPWVHLDIAGTAWTEKDSAWQMKGATGAMIRTLIELAHPSG